MTINILSFAALSSTAVLNPQSIRKKRNQSQIPGTIERLYLHIEEQFKPLVLLSFDVALCLYHDMVQLIRHMCQTSTECNRPLRGSVCRDVTLPLSYPAIPPITTERRTHYSARPETITVYLGLLGSFVESEGCRNVTASTFSNHNTHNDNILRRIMKLVKSFEGWLNKSLGNDTRAELQEHLKLQQQMRF